MFEGKVFGIGWHKTATTSLQAALDMIGFQGVHWPHQMMGEIAAGNTKFKIVDEVKSLSDFPVPLIFKRLDQGYPGSKFILTVRDTESWLKSIEKHLDLQNKPQERLGGLSIHENLRRRGVPSDVIHLMAYRQLTFDKDVFKKAYEDHNAEVKEHFKDRPDDLLVMDMADGAGWDLLCPFLGVDTPDEPYPTKHKTSEREKNE